MMQFDFPYHVDSQGRTARTGEEDHIRDMIEQLLFTIPGERVNRPDFGCGLLQLVFAPNSNELASATQMLVQGALQQWLGDLIELHEVQIENIESTLYIKISYTIRKTGQIKTETFSREV